MTDLVGAAAKYVAGNQASQLAHQFEPEVGASISYQDPLYEYYEKNGKQKRRKVGPVG